MISLVFDTETTGLIKNSVVPIGQQPRIIEFCGHLVDSEGEVIDRVDSLCSCPEKLEPIITRITGIHDRDLLDQPSFAELVEDIGSLMAQADRVVAHNLAFDKGMLDNELKRLGHETWKWPELICTVEQTMHLEGFRLSLQKLHEYLFGEGFPNAHRARVDVAALTKCYLKLVEQEEI